jgi:hypothetical protein
MLFQKISWMILVVMSFGAPTLLSAEGILTITTPKSTTSFTQAELLGMPQTTVVTLNDYVDDVTTFQGPSLRLLLEKLDISQDATLKMVALNGFSSHIPASDAFNYSVVLAVLRNGKTMPVREKGPIWVIYPMDEHPELQSDIYNGRLVWQLKSISVE